MNALQRITASIGYAIALLLAAASLSGLAGCAGTPRPRADAPPADLLAFEQQFARAQYRESLAGCRGIIAGAPGCDVLGRALYYCALNTLQLKPDEAGRAEAAGYLRQLVALCPGSPRRLEADAWLKVISCPADNDRELERLRAEVRRLTREIDQLKDVDMDMHRRQQGS